VSKVKRKTEPPKKKRQAPAEDKRKFPIGWIVGGVLVVALVIAILLSVGSSNSDETREAAFGEPVVTGDPLTPHTPEVETSLGAVAPFVAGADFDGTAVSIENNGKAKAIVFLAHWCPHCQDEVPEVQAWLDENELPPNVELLSVATGTNSVRENYPPQDWLESEGWTPPVIVDDEGFSVGNAYGLSAFPYWVYLDSEGRLVNRTAGNVPVEQFEATINLLAEGG
jgi:thiol-disulfide isomerase/thioredoxin